MSVQNKFTGKRAAEIVGITYRQLDYWARTDLVRPSLTDAKGSGSRRSYSYSDLLELKVIKSLLDAGIKLETVREAFAYIREHLDGDVAATNLVISGANSVLARSGEELVDLVQNGQGVLNVLPLGGLKESVDAKIVELQTGRNLASESSPHTEQAKSHELSGALLPKEMATSKVVSF